MKKNSSILLKSLLVAGLNVLLSVVLTCFAFAAPSKPAPSKTLTIIKNVDYNALNQITKIDYGNGVSTLYTYDLLSSRLRKIYTTNLSGVVLQDLEYAYDSAGNIRLITDRVNTSTQSFKYDELNRLKQAVGSYGTKNYVYDKIGNILEKDGVQYFYGANGAGPHAVTLLSNTTSFQYDANGNMVKKTDPGNITTVYTYDVENRLTKVDKNGQNIALYYYDGDGGRTKTIVGSVITTIVGNLYEETSTRKTKYLFLGNTRIASSTNGNFLYFHADHLGSANVLTDASGVRKELVEYEPFGKIVRDDKSGTADQIARYYFTGKKLDDETGLVYFGARYYNPDIGRFITPDLIVQSPYDPQTLNRYSYTSNNPINRVDYDGHRWSWRNFWNSFIGAVIGAVVTVATGGLGAPLAFAFGGIVGGAVSGGLSGGFQGALMGAAMGGVLGGAVGWGVSSWGAGFGYGALAAAGGYSVASGNADSFLGGISGGYVGSFLGNGYLGASSDYMSEQSPTKGIRAGYSYEDNENVAFLGAWTGKSGATSFANENQMTTVYTKSRGILADLFRAGFKKLGVKGPYVDQAANYLNVSEGKFILAHSEGAQNLAAGIKAISSNGTKFNSLEIKWAGAAISRVNATNLAGSIGAKSSYGMNWADPVGSVSTFNPAVMSIYGGLGLVTGGMFHGTDYYVR